VPRYRYFCNICKEDFISFHAISLEKTDCDLCESTDIERRLTKPIKKIKKKDNVKVGSLTNKYIEENREILKTLKENREENE
jgi:hypothetical protein